MESAGKDPDLLGDPPARRVHHIKEGDFEPGGLLLDADDLLNRLLAPRPRLDGVVVGHDADGAATHATDTGDDAVGRCVGLLRAREQPVFLEVTPGIEQALEPLADEELALGLELVAILDVPLLDAGPFLLVALLARAHGRCVGLALAHTMMISTPSACLGPPMTAGFPDAAWMLVFSSARPLRSSRTRNLTVFPLTPSGVTSS